MECLLIIKNVDPDEMPLYKLSYLDLHCLHRCLIWSQGLRLRKLSLKYHWPRLGKYRGHFSYFSLPTWALVRITSPDARTILMRTATYIFMAKSLSERLLDITEIQRTSRTRTQMTCLPWLIPTGF